MASVAAFGCEVEAPVNAVSSIDNPAVGTITGTVTRDTSNQQSPGRGCYACASGAGNAAAFLDSWNLFTSAAVRTYYARGYFRFGALPGSTVKILRFGPNTGVSARVTSGGKLQLFNDNAGTQIGSDSVATLTTGTYYRVELSVKMNGAVTATTDFELRLDGTTVASATGLSLTSALQVSFGWIDAPGANKTLYVDDCKLNDSSGSANTGFPGNGRVIVMLPISDNSRGAWTAGAGGTTNLFDAVNNIPPAGVADASATNTSQIKNKSATNPTSCDLNLDTYINAGVGSSDTVNFVQLWAVHGEDPATGTKAGTVTIVSNPAGSASSSFNFGDDAGAQATYVGLWKWGNQGIGGVSSADGPSVTLSTAPVVRVTCTSGSTTGRAASCCFLGMIVDYTIGATVYQKTGVAVLL